MHSSDFARAFTFLATSDQGFLIRAEALQSLLIKDTTHTLRNGYYLLMVILTLIELSALISKLILNTKSYSSKVDFYIWKELQETAMDKGITTTKREAFKKAALEKETKLIEEFFTKTKSTKAESSINLLIIGLQKWPNLQRCMGIY